MKGVQLMILLNNGNNNNRANSMQFVIGRFCATLKL